MAILVCQAAYQIAHEMMTSTLKNISLMTANFDETCRGMLSKDVRKAAWNETSLWLAMIQPRSKRAVSPRSLRNAKQCLAQNPETSARYRSRNVSYECRVVRKQ